ncbi:uncharacterized protein LOC105833000 isoform X2 [Monomorium pharaonis]|uniref:uncharacterized protein LOC105833000 isoform X2 n=1 Tax=Monomorium pharaonis TaxID=307658 RepID=UPI00063F653C|nr:uncharacterized protein LOC105833000 isoform X2 [Monomorium pharaonis]
MYLPSNIFCCFMLLFVVLSSEFQGNSTKNDKQKKNSMVHINLFESSMKYSNDKSSQHNAIKNSIKNIEMQYKLYVNSTKNNRKNDNNSKRYESRKYIKADCERSKQMELDANSTKINDSMLQEIEYLFKAKNESNFTSCKDENFHTNDNIEVIFVPNEECDNVSCIQLCCPFTDKLTMEGNCVEKGNGSFFFPPFIAYAKASEHVIFNVTFHNPCVLQEFQHSVLDLKIYDFYENGTIRDPNTHKLISSTDYCFAILNQIYIWNFFFLSTFFWLNVTCFDMWYSFRKFGLHQTDVKQEKKNIFMIYSIYAWGMPLIFNIIFAILDYVKIPNWPKKCLQKFSFNKNRGIRLFFLVPVGVTLISNVCFFIATVIIMYQYKRTAKKPRKSPRKKYRINNEDNEDNKNNENKQRLNMCQKLFIMMGVVMGGGISEATMWVFDDDSLTLDIIDYFLTTMNTSQGLIIFILFVCTKNIKDICC